MALGQYQKTDTKEKSRWKETQSLIFGLLMRTQKSSLPTSFLLTIHWLEGLRNLNSYIISHKYQEDNGMISDLESCLTKGDSSESSWIIYLYS